MTRARRASARGFTLTELAVVMAIVAMLLGGLMYTLSAQTDVRNVEEARRRLELARDLLLGFAIVNGRLPCPATSTSNGIEAPSGGGACTGYLPNSTNTTGYLPGVTIGFNPVDSSGFAVDPWGNRIRYAVAANATTPGSGCTSPTVPGSFTTAASLKSNGVFCAPLDLVICSASSNTDSAASPPSCGTWITEGHARAVTAQKTVVAVVLVQGKNAAFGSAGADDAENVDNDGVFVYHEPRSSEAAGGEYDDQIIWISVGELYGKLLGAGVLP